MTRAQRQLLGACLGVFLLCVLYRYHRTAENLPPTHFSTGLDGKTDSHWPVTEVQQFPKIQSTALDPSISTRARQSSVKDAFERCWQSYQALAWAADEFTPLSGSSKNVLGGWGSTLIDNLDTLWIMGMHDEFKEAVTTVSHIRFSRTQSPEINTHEANIRLLGGLLAAFDLSADQKLLRKSIELGNMLYAAFDTPNGMPIIHWDLNRGSHKKEKLTEERVLVAELGSFIMEFTRLSQITGDLKYFDAAQRVMEFLESQQDNTQVPGLWPVSMNATAELFYEDNFTLGAETSSLYKSLPGAYVLLGGRMPMYRKMYENATMAASENNIFRPMNPEDKDILVSGNIRAVREDSKTQIYLESQVQYQSCFAGGMFALGGALFNNPTHQEIAHKLVDGCIWAHQVIPLGIMPEAFDAVPCASQTNCPWSEWHWKQEVWKNANSLEPEPIPNLNVNKFIKEHRLPKGFTGVPKTAYNLRPEAIESIFTLYRITGREDLLDAAWNIFQAIQNATQAKNGNAAIVDVTVEGGEPTLEDSMDSIWMSRTLKYFYLMFGSSNTISLDEFVFNAGGHPLRRPSAS
ncbi:hypothetical protein N7457_009041 [Penicillium paradoxum]|uniref:uncharacterized protein n=1 Tax=Penicillium paradoxum TaxID=176176 RepID=UPI0025489128|nr:uncharacterized protein N7457_009041 [Penicillium paradoxum]KAJ5774145.1 hypothetical protein N7457_009041 [Penicillium paradoxum]